MAEQLSMFDLLGIGTPVIPLKDQKKGMKGWVIDISAIMLRENGFPEDVTGVCTQPVMFQEDSRKDRDGRWFQAARSIHGIHHGWYGPVYTVYAKRPTWEECVAYAHERKGLPEKVVYYERSADFNTVIREYENGYQKGA